MRQKIHTTVISGKRVEVLTRDFQSIWKYDNRIMKGVRVTSETPKHAKSSIKKVAAHTRRQNIELQEQIKRRKAFEMLGAEEYRKTYLSL